MEINPNSIDSIWENKNLPWDLQGKLKLIGNIVGKNEGLCETLVRRPLVESYPNGRFKNWVVFIRKNGS